MFNAGNLLHFPRFIFEDGSSKSKFFLVLKVIEDKIIISSLPSSIDHLPANHGVDHGCLELPESGVNCYIFKKNAPITENNWGFSLTTMLYGEWIGDYEIDSLKKNNPELIGTLTQKEFNSVIDCFKNSKKVRNKYRRLLS